MTPTDPIQEPVAHPSNPTLPIYVDLRTQDRTSKDPFRPVAHIHVASWYGLGKSLITSLRFLMQTEAHVYAFAVAVNILISFYPFLVAIILICRHVFNWQAAIDMIIQTVAGYFPGDFGFNVSAYLRPASWQKNFNWLSLFLLFLTANGIFTPLEVAFNRIWGIKQNRSFLRNQVIGLALIFVCGAVVLASVCLTTATLKAQVLDSAFGLNQVAPLLRSLVLHIIALPVAILLIFLIYWLLPNAKIPVKRLLPSSAAVAILLQISEYLNLLTWPWLRDKLRANVPPFVQSVSIIFWAFIATLIILAGAEWAARVKLDTNSEEQS
jgi:membrane protein